MVVSGAFHSLARAAAHSQGLVGAVQVQQHLVGGGWALPAHGCVEGREGRRRQAAGGDVSGGGERRSAPQPVQASAASQCSQCSQPVQPVQPVQTVQPPGGAAITPTSPTAPTSPTPPTCLESGSGLRQLTTMRERMNGPGDYNRARVPGSGNGVRRGCAGVALGVRWTCAAGCPVAAMAASIKPLLSTWLHSFESFSYQQQSSTAAQQQVSATPVSRGPGAAACKCCGSVVAVCGSFASRACKVS